MRSTKKPYWASSSGTVPTKAPPGKLLPLISQKPTNCAVDPNEGFIQKIERGQAPDSIEMEMALTDEGPMRASRAPVHAKSAKNTHPTIMTETSGFNKMKDYKLDYSEIEKIPPKLNMRELKKWEMEEERAKHSAAAAASVSPPEVNEPEAQKVVPVGTESRDDPRTYTELLDLYSMHEFIIRKGKTLRNTPEFASFKRNYTVSWGNIESLLQMLETLLKDFGVDLAYIDGKRLANLASYYGGGLLTQNDLVDCISNYDDVAPLIGTAERQYHYGAQGHHLAAAKIQSVWRMYKQRVAFVHLLLGTRAAFLIQRQWASYRAHCTTRRAIAARKETRLTRWRQTMDNFLTNWPRIADARRTIIHIPSLSLPPFHTGEVPFYLEQQLGQLTRLADLADPLVNIIMVAPFKPEQEILAYYFSMLEDAGVTNISGRFTILVPEDAKRLPKGVSLTRMTMLSFRLMKLLAAAGKGKPAYIVPCVVGMEELSLAAELNIPLLSPEPRVAQVFGVKSGCRRLLDSADVATPPGSTHIKGCSDLLRALASLMVEHRTVSRWLVKIETESGSRGHAYFDVSRIRALKSPPADTEELEKNIVREIEEEGQKRVRLVHNTYKTWTQFIEMVDKVGACVEAVPNKVVANLTANLFIEPGGEIRLCSVVEVTLSPAYTVMGCVFPPVSEIPYEAVRDAAVSVARAAFRKRIIGYMSVDFCVFVSGGNEKELACPRIWGVDVDLCLTNNAAAHQFVTVLTNSTFDPQTGQAAFDQTPLRYFYSGLIYNPFLSLVRHSNFFSLCQSRHLTFDKERKRGVVFHLVDVLLRGCIGVLTIDSNFTKAVKQMSDFQSLLNLELPKQGEHALDSNFVFFASSVRQLSRN